MAKILLVEDDNNLREIYEARLQAEGYEIVSARDGEEALTVAMKERPELIISDVMMPKISGFDMLDIIRSTNETKDAKVIMMTALSQAEDKERAEKLGADRYLVKSQVTLEDVAKVAREVLSGESQPSANPVAAATPTADGDSSAPAQQDTPTPAPVADTPTPATPAPAADGAATSDPPTADTTVPAPAATTPDPVPATPTATPAAVVTNTSSTTPTTEEPATPPTEPPAADDTAAMSKTVEDEQSAIATQIEDALKTEQTDKVDEAAPTPAEPEQQPDTPAEPAASASEPAAPAAPAEEPSTPPATEAPAAQSAFQAQKKKVIEPLNDPTESSGPNLEKLVKKEEEKEKMAEIAKNLSKDAQATDKADEAVAAAELRAAAREVAATQKPEAAPAQSTTEVQISDSGEIQTPAPAPAPEQPATPETTPESNGTNIDGVKPAPAQSQQPAADTQTPEPTTPAAGDPNAIAL